MMNVPQLLANTKPRPVTPELQQAVQKLILDLVNKQILTIDSRDGMKVNLLAMKNYIETHAGKRQRFAGTGMKLLLACPANLHGALADQMPDGSRDWQANKEFIDWLRDRDDFQWLREFPLAGRNPRSVV
jgi:hypothetical protein